MRCSKCDKQSPIGSRYCVHCGAIMAPAAVSTSGTAPKSAPLNDIREELDCVNFVIQEIEASLISAAHPPQTLTTPLGILRERQHDLEERLLQLFVELPTGEATSHIKDFLRLHPWNASAHRNLGSIYSRIGQDDWAVDETVLTILSGSEQAEAHLRLAQLYERMGRKVEALYEYRTCEGLEPPPGLKNTAITKPNNLDRELFGPDRGSAEAIVATLYRVETLLSTLEEMDTATPEESDFVDELLEMFPQRLALRTAPDRRQWMREAGYNLALMREVEQWSGRGIISQDSAARVHSHLREQCETLEQILGDDYSAEPASPSDQYSDHVAVQLDRFFEQRLLERHEYQALIASYLPQPRPAVAVAGAPATARPAMPPAPPRQPRPPAPPREPFDWGAFWLGIFSERILVTVLGFGVLLVAISSLVLLINSWGDFSWYIRQAFLIGQFFMFLAVGYTLMNRLNLHLSGLALITIASIWVPLNIGALVFEFIPAPAEMLLPGIDIPMDLPIHGWLIITGVTFPIWALFTFKFRGHVHAHGTVWAACATVALALSVSGLQWEWSVASLAVMTIPLAFVWERMRHTSYRPIAEPLFWTSQSILVSITGVLLIGWLLGNASGYSLATVGLAGTALYVIFNHYSPRLVYQYLFSSLPVIAVLFAMGESRILPLRYFDALLIVFGIVYVISGARWESKYVSGRLRSAYWPVFQPVYAAGYLCALLAVLWPAYDPISRAFALFGATAIATYSAYRWSRVYWTSTASVLLVAAILLSLDSLGQIDPIYWGIGLGILAWAYLAAGVVMRRAPIHAESCMDPLFCRTVSRCYHAAHGNRVLRDF